MADFSLPTLVTQYADFLTQMKQRDEDIIKMLDSTTSTNLPIGSKRWNSMGNKWEKYDGTAWSNLSALYEITVRNSDKLNGQSASYYATATHTHTDYATATHTHTGYAASTHTHDTLYPSKTGTGASGNWAINITGSSASCTGNAATATTATKLNNAVEATTAIANTIVKRDANGYIYNGPINTNIGDTTTAASHYFVEAAGDGFIRPKTLANVKAEIAGDKAPLASPALTGTPTAPTAAVGTDTTQLATTAFVQANKPTINASSVAAATAGISAGAVGSYAFLLSNGSPVSIGSTKAASSLYYAAGTQYYLETPRPTGTWRAMSFDKSSTTLWLRIA